MFFSFLFKRGFWIVGLGMLGVSLILSSCGNTRQFTYMQGKFDTAKLSQILTVEPVIQKGDVLSIVVFSDNPTATAIYNPAGGGATGSTGGSTSTTPASSGYLVDENGNVEFQGLGLLHVDGLTRSQLKELLDSKLKEFLQNPYYNIRFFEL